jgi:hypothetical protein
MMNQLLRLSVIISLVACACLPLSSCSTVPKEVVELSYRMGEDIEAVHESYKNLIHDHFELLRGERIRYLDEEWTPKYIGAWIDTGRLRDIVKGDIVWSEERSEFIQPIQGREELGLLTTVTLWSMTAIQEIEGKKADLLEPLNKQEGQLSSLVDQAFNRLYRGNATITAHLNSLRKVQEVQDNALAALNLKDLRAAINNTLVTASEQAEAGLEAVRKADGLVQKAGKNIRIGTKAN